MPSTPMPFLNLLLKMDLPSFWMAPSRDNKPSRRGLVGQFNNRIDRLFLSRILYFSAERRRFSGFFLISLLGK